MGIVPVEEVFPPSLPKKQKAKAADFNLYIELLVKQLNSEWDLGLELPNPNESPKRTFSPERVCFSNIKFLSYRSAIEDPYRQFQTEAETLYRDWALKPNAERGVIPTKSRQNFRPVSLKERTQLLQLFIRITESVKKALLEEEIKTRSPGRRHITNSPTAARSSLNDDPIGIDLPLTKPISRSKRSYDEQEATIGHSESYKRPRNPEDPPVNSNPFVNPSQPEGARLKYGILPSFTSENSIVPSVERGRVSENSQRQRSVNTSFASSHKSSVFDQSARHDMLTALTQETVPDHGDDIALKPCGQPDSQISENYGSTLDPSAFDNSVQQSQNVQGVTADADTIADTLQTEMGNETLRTTPASTLKERRLYDQLLGVFPDKKNIPACFFLVPLHVRYEILRVFLHTGVSLSELKLPLRKQDWADYSNLWDILKRMETMNGKSFPEKVGKEAWAAANNEFRQGHRGLTQRGSLRYNRSSTGPLFKFFLGPLKLDLTHRLSRRFGCDRFLEIDMPNLSSNRIPKVMQDLGPSAKTIVIKWLGSMHQIMGRIWVPFSTKPRERRQRKDSRQQSHPDVDSEPIVRLYFFAIHGDDFRESDGTPKVSETMYSRSSWSVGNLLNWVRPTSENKDQPAHKLYARTTLVLSRNTPTIVLDRTKIYYRSDIRNDNKEVMTDGAGRISQASSLRIAHMLGLPHLPSGFQGRFGEAKGFWSVDPKDRSSDEWIEIYESQQKWRRAGTIEDIDFDDAAHRTFEVNKFSGKLRAADLNQQLMPILMDRAKSKPQMRDSLAKLLKDCLRNEVDKIRIAMNNPQSFRKLVRDGNTGLSDRVKYGCVQFKAAMPDALDEKMNMLLDAGFEPLKNHYLKELARQAYERKCEDLKQKMNVTILKSTYAFMVPDWTGSLEEGEVFLNPSEGFSEDLSLFTGLPLQVDALVARMPAHFNSDIQRVRVVLKPELLGLRDIIVFSTQGACLAAKLSGGDYDGDIAWVCWESSLVDHFDNAKVPNCPDLVKEGFIEEDARTYAEIVYNKDDPTATFLNHSMSFSLEQSILGICSAYKEAWCYTYDNIHSREAVYLSKLLSDLVDQAKAGYVFTETHFQKFKACVVKNPVVRVPLYKSTDTDPKAKHIIDRLKHTAKVTINDVLTKFAASLPDTIPCWDDDLIRLSAWANREAIDNHEWRSIIYKLTTDLREIKQRWAEEVGSRSRGPMDESRPAFGQIITDMYERFQSIQPTESTPLTRLLLESCNGRPELSVWALLRASCLFASYSKWNVSTFVWWMGGIQLCHLKAMNQGITVAVTPQQYAMLKPDATFVKLRASENEYQWDARVLEVEGNPGENDDTDNDI